MHYTYAQYQESAAYIRGKIRSFVPKVAMVLGSGLGFLGDEVENAIRVPYGEIPHFKASTAPGHKGQLVFGTLRGQNVAVMQGRMHHYEGYSYEEVSYAVRVLRLLGCDTLVVTNAAGGVNLDFHAGDLMLITDQIKIFMESPLRGENIPQFGPRFPDASHLYTPALQDAARAAARDACGGPLRPDRRGRCRGHVHRPRGHHRRPLRDAGAGLHPAEQHGRRHFGPAPLRAGGAGRRRGLQGQVLPASARLPGAAVSTPLRKEGYRYGDYDL